VWPYSVANANAGDLFNLTPLFVIHLADSDCHAIPSKRFVSTCGVCHCPHSDRRPGCC